MGKVVYKYLEILETDDVKHWEESENLIRETIDRNSEMENKDNH